MPSVISPLLYILDESHHRVDFKWADHLDWESTMSRADKCAQYIEK